MSQARKYHLNLIVANQFTTQLSEEIRDAVFGNVGSVVCFRVGTTDAEFLAKQYAPVFDIDDLQFLPNANTAVRMMIGGVPVQPFSMATLPPLGNPNPQLADALKQLSAAKYGRPKAKVESEIFARLTTQAPPRPAMPPSFGSSSPFGPLPSAVTTQGTQISQTLTPGPLGPPAKPSTSSFLDEWLAKRKTTTPSVPSGVSAVPPSGPRPQPVAQVIKPEPAQPSSSAASENGEIKVDRSQGASEQSHTVHIDRDGNLSFGE